MKPDNFDEVHAVQNDVHSLDNIEFQSIESRSSDLSFDLVCRPAKSFSLKFLQKYLFLHGMLGRLCHKNFVDEWKKRNSIFPWERLILRKSQWIDMNSTILSIIIDLGSGGRIVSVKSCNECLTYVIIYVSSAIHVHGKLDEPNFINQRCQNGCSEDLLASLIVHNSNTNAFWLSSCRC